MLSFVEKYFVSHHYLRGINSFVFAFIGRDFKRLGDRFDAGQDMGDGGFQSNPSGTHQPHSVLEMPKSTDVRKDPTQAALAQQVDVYFERLAEPGDPDKLAARADSVNSLGQCLASGKSLLRAAAGAFKDHVGAISPRQLPDDGNRVLGGGVNDDIRSELFRNPERFLADIDGHDESGAAHPGNLHTLETHAALAENRHRFTEADVGGLYGGDTVTEGLQAGTLVVGNSVIQFHQGDFGNRRKLRETTRELKADNGALPAEVGALREAQRTVPTRQLGARGDTVSRAELADSLAGFHNPGAEFVPKELHRSLGFEPSFDLVERQSWDATGQLRFGHARLNTDDLRNHVAWLWSGQGNFIEPHIIEAIKTPSLHSNLQHSSQLHRACGRCYVTGGGYPPKLIRERNKGLPRMPSIRRRYKPTPAVPAGRWGVTCFPSAAGALPSLS